MSIFTKISAFHVDRIMHLQTPAEFHVRVAWPPLQNEGFVKAFFLLILCKLSVLSSDSLSPFKMHMFLGGRKNESKGNTLRHTWETFTLCRYKHYELIYPQSVSFKLSSLPRRPQDPSSRAEFTYSEFPKKMFLPVHLL